MNASIIKTAIAVGAAVLAACTNQDFSEYYEPGSGPDRKNEYTQDWIERFGLFDPEHDWTTLQSVDAEITAEYGPDIEARVYNADPETGGHLIGYSRGPGRLTLDLPKEAGSVYAVIADGKGGTLLSGEFDVALRSVAISSARAHAPEMSRSVHTPSYFDAMVVCEDLGGIGDYDFNDVVLGLRHVSGTNTLKVMPMAAGGTMRIDVYYGDATKPIGEIHDMIVAGSDVKTMINTTRFENIGRMVNVMVPAGFSLSKNWKDIRLAVRGKGETVEISGPDKATEAPQMFCLGGDWYWPTEYTAVDDAYTGFAAWTTSMLEDKWADRYSDISKVVVWDVSQIKPNWFSGVTADGNTYKAKIDGAAKAVDVESGKEYYLDPPTSLANMFDGASMLTSLDVATEHFDTSLASDMSSVFRGCRQLETLDLSNWDTGKVETMQDMFRDCDALTDLNLSGMNTKQLTNANNMFLGCDKLRNLNISNWDISKMENANSFFSGCTSLETVTMNHWVNTTTSPLLQKMINSLKNTKTLRNLVMQDCNFAGVTDLGNSSNGIFTGLAQVTTLDVTNWNIPDLVKLEDAFSGCKNLTAITGINTWKVPEVTDLEMAFFNCSKLESLDLSGWQTGGVTSMQNMFNGCAALTDLNLANLNTSQVTNVYQMFKGCSSLRHLDISGWNISNLTNSGSFFTGCTSLETVTMNRWVNSSARSDLQTIIRSLKQIETVRTLVMQNCNFTGKTRLGSSNTGLFDGLNQLTTIDVTGWETPDLEELYKAFHGCQNLKTIIGINTWNLPRITDLSQAFKDCGSLTELDLSNWTTGTVTDMQHMFSGCTSLVKLNLTNLNTSSVTTINQMFQNCSSLRNLDLSGWDISNMSTANSMFLGCTSLESVTMDRWKNTKSTQLRTIIKSLDGIKSPDGVGTVNKISMRDCDFSELTSFRSGSFGLFEGCTSFIDIDVTGWNISKLTDLQEMFSGCKNLKTITGITRWQLPNVKSLSQAFYQCGSLADIDLSGWYTEGVTDMMNMFNGCSSLVNMSLANFNTSSVTAVNQIFQGCTSLRNVDLTGWDISSMTSVNAMFSGCTSLETVTMDKWKNSKSTQLRTIVKQLNDLKTQKEKRLSMRNCNFTGLTSFFIGSNGLFDGCSSLTDIDVTGWHMPHLKDLKRAFFGCSALSAIPGIDSWEMTEELTSLTMTFYGCTNLTTLDLSKWNVSGVTDMQNTFRNCNALMNLDISGWDINETANLTNMFLGCPSGITIRCKKDTKDKLTKKGVATGLSADSVVWDIVDAE